MVGSPGGSMPPTLALRCGARPRSPAGAGAGGAGTGMGCAAAAVKEGWLTVVPLREVSGSMSCAAGGRRDKGRGG